MCEGDYCRVSPGNMEHLQDMLQSNRVVHFEKGDYHITPSSGGFIQVQDVVNLTIIGHGVETQILCSPNATFAFYFNNVSNLTISGLSISSCSAPVPDTLIDVLSLSFYSCPPFTNVIDSSSVLVLDSDHVVLSNVTIKTSPGFALVSIQSSLPHQHLRVEDSDMSFNTQGSLLLHQTTAILSRNNFISNNISLWSFDSGIRLTDSYFLNSPVIFVRNQQILLFGKVTIDQSSTCIIESNFWVKKGNVTFSNLSKLFFSKSSLEITSVSSVIFKELSNHAIYFHQSSIYIKKNARLMLFINTFYNSTVTKSNVTISEDNNYSVNNSIGSLLTLNTYDYYNDNQLFLIEYCNVTISENASLIFEHNFVNYTISFTIIGYNNIVNKDVSFFWIQYCNVSISENASLIIKHNSVNYTISFHIIGYNNIVNKDVSFFLIQYCNISISENASLIIKHNFVNEYTTLFTFSGFNNTLNEYTSFFFDSILQCNH